MIEDEDDIDNYNQHSKRLNPTSDIDHSKYFNFKKLRKEQDDVFKELESDDDLFIEIDKERECIDSDSDVDSKDKDCLEPLLEIKDNSKPIPIILNSKSKIKGGKFISEEEHEKIFADFKTDESIPQCKNTKQHLQETELICQQIMKYIENPKHCISFVVDWFRNRIFPNLSERNEIMFLMIHVLFTPISFNINSADGFIFFDSFDYVHDFFELNKYFNQNYTIAKERFSIRLSLLEDNEKCSQCILYLLDQKCLNKPRSDFSGHQCEINNFAHNDMLHFHSASFRFNIIKSILYYKLRLNVGNYDVFQTYQLMFVNILSHINYLIYVYKEIFVLSKDLIRNITNLMIDINKNDIYFKLNQKLFEFYSVKEKHVDVDSVEETFILQ